MEYDLLIREAEISDASEVIALLDQIGQESSFTSLDENGLYHRRVTGTRCLYRERRVSRCLPNG